MSTTKHLTVRDALKTLIAGASLVAADQLTGNRNRVLPDDVAADIQVWREKSEPIEPEVLHDSAPIDWLTQLRVRVRARSTNAATAEAKCDDLMAQIYAAVMADRTLGGTVSHLASLAFEWDQDEASTSIEAATWTLFVRHRTASHTLT